MPEKLLDAFWDILYRYHVPSDVQDVGPVFFVRVCPVTLSPKHANNEVSKPVKAIEVSVSNVKAFSPEALKELRSAFNQYISRRRKAREADYGDRETGCRIRLILHNKRKNTFSITDSPILLNRLERQFKDKFSFEKPG